MLQICMGCGQVRESDVPLACARVYHSDHPRMIELTEEVRYLGDNPHPLLGKTSMDKGFHWLNELDPDSVVVAEA